MSFPSCTIKLRLISWLSDSNGLFDFESQNVSKEYPSNYYIISDLETFYDKRLIVCEIQCYRGKFCLIQTDDLSNKLWMVIRANNNNSCSLNVGDRLKIGRIEMRLRELVVSDTVAHRATPDVSSEFRNSNCPLHGLLLDDIAESKWQSLTKGRLKYGESEDQLEAVTHFNLIPGDEEDSDKNSFFAEESKNLINDDGQNRNIKNDSSSCTCHIPILRNISNNTMKSNINQSCHSDSSPPTCRICLDEEDNENKNPLIAPCSCRGSMAFVHLNCLRRWMEGRLRVPEEAAAATQAMVLHEMEEQQQRSRDNNSLSVERQQDNLTAFSVTNFIHNPLYTSRPAHSNVPERLSENTGRAYGSESAVSAPANPINSRVNHLSPNRIPIGIREIPAASIRGQDPLHQNLDNSHSHFSSSRNRATSFFFTELSCELCLKPYPPSITVRDQILDLFPLPRPVPPYAILETSFTRHRGENIEGMHVVSLAAHAARVGRSAENEIRMNDISVSRLHATLSISNTDTSSLILQDCFSKFGSGKQIQKRILLPANGDGTFLQNGSLILWIHVEESSSPFYPSPILKDMKRKYTNSPPVKRVMEEEPIGKMVSRQASGRLATSPSAVSNITEVLSSATTNVSSHPKTNGFLCCRRRSRSLHSESNIKSSSQRNLTETQPHQKKKFQTTRFDENVMLERLQLDGIGQDLRADFILPHAIRRRHAHSSPSNKFHRAIGSVSNNADVTQHNSPTRR